MAYRNKLPEANRLIVPSLTAVPSRCGGTSAAQRHSAGVALRLARALGRALAPHHGRRWREMGPLGLGWSQKNPKDPMINGKLPKNTWENDHFWWNVLWTFVVYNKPPVTPGETALAVSSLACWHSALACQHSRAQHSLQCIFPGVHPSRYVCLDLDSGCFYWNRKNALEWRSACDIMRYSSHSWGPHEYLLVALIFSTPWKNLPFWRKRGNPRYFFREAQNASGHQADIRTLPDVFFTEK